jgi:hypothetical protein
MAQSRRSGSGTLSSEERGASQLRDSAGFPPDFAAAAPPAHGPAVERYQRDRYARPDRTAS